MSGWPTGVGRSARASDPDLAKEAWAAWESMTGVSFPL
jgi:hypothetical protein